jgi:hypothetical protein
VQLSLSSERRLKLLLRCVDVLLAAVTGPHINHMAVRRVQIHAKAEADAAASLQALHDRVAAHAAATANLRQNYDARLSDMVRRRCTGFGRCFRGLTQSVTC